MSYPSRAFDHLPRLNRPVPQGVQPMHTPTFWQRIRAHLRKGI